MSNNYSTSSQRTGAYYTDPVISSFMRIWDRELTNSERESLLNPLIPRLVHLQDDKDLVNIRAMMAADWLIRSHTSIWFRLAEMDNQADAIERLPEITDFSQCFQLTPILEVGLEEIKSIECGLMKYSTWNSSKEIVKAAAGDAAQVTARNSAWTAAKETVKTLVQNSIWELEWEATSSLAREIVLGSARVAACRATKNSMLEEVWGVVVETFSETKKNIHISASGLVTKMIEGG